MSDATLRYETCALEDLPVGACVVRRTRDDAGPHWMLWFRVRDEVGADSGAVVLLAVPVSARGPGESPRRTWGLTRVAPDTWQVSPSIDVADVWHHTPRIVGVPEEAPWERLA